MTDDQSGERPDRPAASDDFDGLVLDDDFVRGGAFEPPARTRAAIARYGDRPTSWRHGGGLGRSGSGGRAGRTATPNSRAPRPWVERLPLIVTVIVVAVVLLLAYH